jgi:glutaredoxin
VSNEIVVTLYKWAGSCGPFKIKIPCGECTLTKDIILDIKKTELLNYPFELIEKDWLSNLKESLLIGGWHAPVVSVNNKIISQGKALNRGVFIQSIIEEFSKSHPIKGNVLYGKSGCHFCIKAKELLKENNVEFTEYDVVKNSVALYEMLPSVKSKINKKTPITTPQIWLDSQYIGGFDELEKHIKIKNLLKQGH